MASGTLPGMEDETVVIADTHLADTHRADAHRADAGQHVESVETAGEVVDELLIEEISIDGMCGVY